MLHKSSRNDFDTTPLATPPVGIRTHPSSLVETVRNPTMPEHTPDTNSNVVIPEPAADQSVYSTEYLIRVCKQVRSEILQYHISPKGTKQSIEEFDVNPLSGHCYESARELSYTLYQADIPHRIVKGGIKPLADQYDEITEPYTMDDIDAVGARHYWVEIDHPDTDTDTTWVLELCSENYDHNYNEIYVGTKPHDCLIRLSEHTDRSPWRNQDPDWWWNTRSLTPVQQELPHSG